MARRSGKALCFFIFFNAFEVLSLAKTTWQYPNTYFYCKSLQ